MGHSFIRYPIVEFDHGEIQLIPPVAIPLGGDSANKYFKAFLVCIPLQLGYAFTVHKVQGLTLDGPVVLDLTDHWRCPHLVYVALSRVRNPEQIIVKGLSSKVVHVDKLSQKFEKKLPLWHRHNIHQLPRSALSSFPEQEMERKRRLIRKKNAQLRQQLQSIKSPDPSAKARDILEILDRARQLMQTPQDEAKT